MFTMVQAAKQLGVSYPMLWRTVSTEAVPQPARFGRILVISEADLEQYRKFFIEKKEKNAKCK